MKKKRKNNSNWGVVLFFAGVMLIILGCWNLFIKKDVDCDPAKDNCEILIDKDEMLKYEQINLTYDMQDIEESLGWLFIVEAQNNSSEGNDYFVGKGIDLLGNSKNRQIFTMEQIILDENTYDNFITLDIDGNLYPEKVHPRFQDILAYYPMKLFKNIYQEYFGEEFSVKSKLTSWFNNSYDQNDDYIYYDNRKIGSNGVYVLDTDIANITYDDKYYNADITFYYSDKTKEQYKFQVMKGNLVYTRDENNLIILKALITE